MEKIIFGKTLMLDTAPVHVAPGGSILYKMSGNASIIAELLLALREEIAYGMMDVSVVSETDKTVEVAIYMGKADVDVFLGMLPADMALAEDELAEDAVMTGLSMRARNMVLDEIAKHVNQK